MFCLFVWHFVCTTCCTAANDRSPIHDRSVHDVRPLHRLWLNKHERVTGWLPQHWPPPACQFSFPIQKDRFSFHTTVLCIHLEKWHSKLVKYKWTELTFYHLTQQYCMPLAHWGWDKMCAISQTMFSNAFSWMKTSEFRIICHWNVFLRV